ncbi:glycosyltransferase family 2 protein [Halocella sp. SP3-1]|uniref:glycosyltransferase family 2 protein n=1 Tax=Halocella sp. SP3-1 TaxID=2382161 RepID=UPI000F7651AE|nr:glycosyltransferase family 2 protein [Halocella sp. SP3-1]AZO93204.1 glycosyltransferase family 2 protein [Halocella sp. SP3-1]
MARKKPLISTVLLNWNRRYLLEQTVNSYLSTVNVPYELIIVDNGSRDGSQEYIKNVCSCNELCTNILLNKNMGGIALNLALTRARSDILHVSENDLQYKPGWVERVIRIFRVFPELGQLSLYAHSPARNEGDIDGERPSERISRQGLTIFQTRINVHSSSVFRREVWQQGIRWKNIGNNGVRFPDDYSFSQEVMKAGYIVAWNDEYLVTNYGHLIDEIKNNLAYYVRDYKAKPGGLEKLRKRIKRFGYGLILDEKEKSGYRLVSLD